MSKKQKNIFQNVGSIKLWGPVTPNSLNTRKPGHDDFGFKGSTVKVTWTKYTACFVSEDICHIVIVA